jgi:hypothetical protein
MFSKFCVLGVLPILLFPSLQSPGKESAAFPPQVELAEIRRLVDSCALDHPRLLVTREELATLPHSIANDPIRTKLAEIVIDQAKQILDEPPVTRQVIGRRLLQTSRRCVSRVLTLAMAFHLTGEKRFAERCKMEMLAAARFSDWNPEHYLDVAEMTFALAIGYDWLFAELDEAARRKIRAAIIEKGIRLQFADRDNWWVTVGNNWGQVCHSGMVAGALAVLEDEPNLAARTIHSAVHNVVPAMQQYAPCGGYPEGPQYWSYGTTYNALLIANLESALATDFGLSAAPGFSDTGQFLALATGPSGQYFNYSDGSAKRSVEPILSWFAIKYVRPEWLVGEDARWQKFFASRVTSKADSLRFIPLALLWYIPSASERTHKLPLNWSSGGQVPIAIFRSGWQDKNATYVGVKAGSPAASHGHMDCGSFVLECDGVRWAIDLEPEDYHAIESRGMNLWDREQDSDRWKLLRLNNLGHNTLAIDGQLQTSRGVSRIVEFGGNGDAPFCIIDLTDAYRGQVTSALRGVAILHSREVVIRDELTGLKPGSRIQWGMITHAEVTGLLSNRVVLSQHEQKLSLAVVTETEGVWKAVDTPSLEREFDSPNPAACRLTFEITAPSSGTLTITVRASPGSCAALGAVSEVAAPLAAWPPSD